MYSVKFDSTELVNATYYLQYARHDSAPVRDLTLMPLSNQDGSTLVAEKYGTKIITVKGHISAATAAALQTQVDTMKELFSGKEKNLDILPSGGITRRYVATCVSHTLTQDFYNVTFLPYMAQFVVPSGAGLDTSVTAAKHNILVQLVSYSSNFTLAGSHPRQYPIITITLSDSWTLAKGIEFALTNGSEDRIIITGDSTGLGLTNIIAWNATDVLIINTDTKKVTYEGVEVEFYRTMPEFLVGQNNFTITVGSIIDESFTPGAVGSFRSIYGTSESAQSFSVTHGDSTYRTIQVYMRKTALNPAGTLTLTIEGDDGGKPDGTPIATATVAAAAVNVTDGWVGNDAAAVFSLTANTRYWLRAVQTGAAGDVTHMYMWGYKEGADATYRKGNISYTVDGGTNWTNDTDADHGFRIRFGNIDDGDLSDDYVYDVDYTKRYL